MYINSVVRIFDKKSGQFCGCQLELLPPLENNAASLALVIEMWHRIRRDRLFKSRFLGEEYVNFDAFLYFKGEFGTGCEAANAALLLNNASGASNFKLDHGESERLAIRSLRYLDKLLQGLINDYKHDDALESISAKFASGNSTAANAELKDLLKFYCRGRGLFINEDDIAHANLRNKERRRQEFLQY